MCLDEQGITLQTLIVTAVLVLMAVAAGVVIVAVTNNANEDLEDQAADIDSPCNEVEIYDPVLAAGGNPGTNGEDNVEGSGIGCIPVCFWFPFTGDDNLIEGNEIVYGRTAAGIEESPRVKEIKRIRGIFQPSESDEPKHVRTDGNPIEYYVFITNKEVGSEGRLPIPDIAFGDSRSAEVRYDSIQNDCNVYDKGGNIMLVLASS